MDRSEVEALLRRVENPSTYQTLTTVSLDVLGELCRAWLATPPAEQASGDTLEAAEAMGASGGPASEPERLAFEAWMRGHCWALCATWNGTEYRSDAEQGGNLCPHATATRMLWAAWRDRAALSQRPVVSKDTERLDWLDSQAHCADWDTGGCEVMRRVIRADDGEKFCADTWREAIDMALAPQQPEKGEG